jgi:hypothetical protein
MFNLGFKIDEDSVSRVNEYINQIKIRENHMSNKSNKSQMNGCIKGWNIFNTGKTPKAPIEITVGDDGKVSKRKVDHVKTIGNTQFVYHPTKGWRKVRDYTPHILLDNLLVSFGLKSMYRDN